MTVTTTDYFGFTAVHNAVPSTNDWAATYWNWIAADEILYGLVAHTHTGAAAVQNPTGTLSLSTATTGGYLPASTTYYIAITYVDALTRETAASDVVSIATGAGITTPTTPTINDDATPTDIQTCPGGLTGGDYWYKISYTKDGGESLPSAPVYVSIPTDDTYECTIHFQSLNEVANGADAIFVYRKIGNSGSYVKLAEITAGATNSYTDDNTGVPTCDKAPVTASTISSFNTITINWAALDYTSAEKVRIYGTTTSGTYPTNSLIAEVDMNDATPVEEYEWTGVARTLGKPPAVSHCYSSPGKITLTAGAEIEGNLPWANLPSDFSWQAPVANSAALPDGIAGEARVVLDEDAIYIWDDDLATPAWTKVSGLVDFEELEIEAFGVINWDSMTTVGIANTHLLIVIPEEAESSDNNNKMVGLFVWREDWATPAWQRLNYCLPFEYTAIGKTPFSTDEPGVMWVRYSESEDTYYLAYNNQDGSATWTFPLVISNQAVGSLNDEIGYFGWWETGMDDITPNYSYGAIRFNWDDKAFQYYDDTIATPAWVDGPGVVKTGETVADVAEDATPTPEQLKINEILEVLRTSGLIET